MMITAIKGLYNSLWLQRLLVMISVAVLLLLIWTAPELYAWWVAIVAVMVLILEYLAFYRGVEYGIRTFYNMSKRDQQRLIKLLEPDNEPQNNNS